MIKPWQCRPRTRSLRSDSTKPLGVRSDRTLFKLESSIWEHLWLAPQWQKKRGSTYGISQGRFTPGAQSAPSVYTLNKPYGTHLYVYSGVATGTLMFTGHVAWQRSGRPKQDYTSITCTELITSAGIPRYAEIE